MSDLISREEALKVISDRHQAAVELFIKATNNEIKARAETALAELAECYVTIQRLQSAESDDWLEKNKDLILQAGMEGREVEFRIGGRLFAIREKAQ